MAIPLVVYGLYAGGAALAAWLFGGCTTTGVTVNDARKTAYKLQEESVERYKKYGIIVDGCAMGDDQSIVEKRALEAAYQNAADKLCGGIDQYTLLAPYDHLGGACVFSNDRSYLYCCQIISIVESHLEPGFCRKKE